ncbi:MAG: hypothetical protein QOF13_1971 [Solirubrobacterales bacterium]|jgi:hypothetical protein|nr:hypothetical protein [Solirubrobacterales bacterium]
MQEASGGLAALVGKNLGVGQARMVVDGDMNELPPDKAHRLAVAMGAQLPPAVAGHPVAGLEDATQLLDVDVDQLARLLSLIAIGRLARLQPG